MLKKQFPPQEAAQRTELLPSPRVIVGVTSGSRMKSMQPMLQHWIWTTAAVLALAVISYLAMPPVVVKQATALLSWG